MMIIGIDGNEANQKIRAGSGIYAFELLKQFKEFRIQNSEFRIYLKDKPLEDLPIETKNWQYKIVGPNKLWTQFRLPIELFREKVLGKAPGVFFSLTHYAPRFCPVPSIITIFDLSFIRFPEMFLKKDLYKLKNWTEYSIKQAKKIITISEFSKKEIIDYYKIHEDKIIIAYPGYDRKKFKIQNSKFKVSEVLKKYKIDMSYILYVGTIQPRKNLVRLLEAFAKLKDGNLKLVICGMIKEGRGGWMQEEILQRIKNLEFRIKNNIVITGYVSEEDISYLMTGAKVLVLPSLYEGFGIPVIEAMACGIPAVVSNVSSLPEIAGDAAIIVDPQSVEGISSGLKEACYNETRRVKLINKGLEQVKRFSWETSAKLILNTLTSVKP